MEENVREIQSHLQELSDRLNLNDDRVAIILAAGHGKRIKSETPKMLHKVWGVPTVLRVATAARKGLNTPNQVIVVGIKAVEVATASGKEKHRVFVYQSEQRGTGHAVKIALDAAGLNDYNGTVFIFPGDVGLLSADVVREFAEAFNEKPCDMMVLTSTYKGDPEYNYYGRIVRVPETDVDGRPAGDDAGKVIEIKEHKDILSLNDDEPYITTYNGRKYAFSREELLNIREFNTGVYAFRARPLHEHINSLREDNVQGELYITDLIAIFNRSGLTVRAAVTQDEHSVLGFNVKSVLKEMEIIARHAAYEKLKDIITIVDRDDFFIADEVIDQILEMDEKEGPLDIAIGKGVYIGPNVRLNKGVIIKNHANLDGNIVLGDHVVIHEGVHLSTYPHQTLRIGARSEILKGDIIKGNLTIGENCRIESSVNMTGSDEYPTRIGNNVLIKGTSYIFGCIIEDDIWIEHSVLKCKYVERTVRKDGTIQPIRWVIPQPQGLDSIHPLDKHINEKS
ncbi:MAG: NTP transferase domain-containing protein [candidate division KSB1 bacterium]|nr:NTP transferase domain-containing protein [candidate division KSB1 bacterium]